MPGSASPLLLYLVKQVELAIRARLDDLFRPIGLTALQYTALTVLERHDNMSSAQLARNSFVTAQSMADMIAALEGHGLIERHRDSADRRRLVVSLTADGRALLDRYRDEVQALEESMIAGLSDAEVVAFRAALNICHGNLSGGYKPTPQAPQLTRPPSAEPGSQFRRGYSARRMAGSICDYGNSAVSPGVRPPDPAAARAPHGCR